MIINYLQSLLDKGLAFHTIKSRVSSIAANHYHFSMKLGLPETLIKVPLVKNFLKGVLLRNPPKRDLVPAWDLPLVLDVLSKPPFEPMEDISMRLLTIKTALLVAVASAGRTCEIKALDRRNPFCTISSRGVVLRFPPSFRPKVVNPENMVRSLDFSPLVPEGDPPNETLNAVCVCRAIRIYLNRTQVFLQGNCTQLFVTFQKGKEGRPASKPTIAYWMKLGIQEAYSIMKLPLPQVKAHSTRKQSTTWAELKNISIQDICQQATWASANVFIKHYKLNIASSVSARHARAVLSVAVDPT